MSDMLIPQNTESAMLAVIERMARDPDVDVEKVQRLLDMRAKERAHSAEVEFNKAMCSVQAAAVKVYKNRTNSHTRSSYADLEAISNQLTPIITENGFSLSFGTDQSPIEKHIRITCTCAHSAGHSRKEFFDLALDDGGMTGKANKTQVQAAGSTISYGRRYLKLMIFDVALTDDNDGNKPEPTEEPKALTPKHYRWDAAVASYKETQSFEKIELQMTLSDAVKAQIIEAANVA